MTNRFTKRLVSCVVFIKLQQRRGEQPGEIVLTIFIKMHGICIEAVQLRFRQAGKQLRPRQTHHTNLRQRDPRPVTGFGQHGRGSFGKHRQMQKDQLAAIGPGQRPELAGKIGLKEGGWAVGKHKTGGRGG